MATTAYVRAALPLLPLASRLPFVAGGGGEMPVEELTRSFTAATDEDRLAAYSRVCGFRFGDSVPPTWPHILAFDEHLALMTDGRFPLRAIGMVHVGNRIEQLRPIAVGDELEMTVTPTALEPHPRGRTFALVTEARTGGELAWRETSTMLAPGGGDRESRRPERGDAFGEIETAATWRLPGDLGRRYAGVSGDRNPIHLHSLTARAFGFPRAIAHGMWTKARALAALEGRVGDAFAVEAEFKKPILLPATVAFGARDGRFVVRDRRTGKPHLEGSVT